MQLDGIKEYFVQMKNFETEIGTLHFITVEEYLDFIMSYGTFVQLDKIDLISNLNDLYQDFPELELLLYHAKKEETELFDIIMLSKSFNMGLYEGYRQMFEHLFHEDVFHLITTSEEFEYYMDLIKETNSFNNEKPNPNPEIERRNKLRRFLEQSKGNDITFEAMYTSVWLAIKQDPNELTWLLFEKLFQRFGQFKNFDTTTLFATVSAESKIEPWYKNLNIEKEKQYIDESEIIKSQKKL